MDDKKFLFETMFNMFTRITTIIMICAGVYICIFWEGQVSANVLFQIPVVGALTSIPCTLLFYKDTLPKKTFLIREILFYIYVNIVVFTFGTIFEWVRFETPYMAIGLFFDILVVCLLAGVVAYCFDQGISNKMNDRLRKINDIE